VRFSSFLGWFRRLITRRRPSPLISHTKDLHLVRRLRGRTMPTWTQWLHVGLILSRTERLFFRIGVGMFAMGIVWLGIVGVGYAMERAPQVGGEYIEAIVGSPEFINPLFAPANDVDRDISSLVFSGLMQYDKDQRLIPDLAVNYSVSDDKKMYTFTLREDVVWHDQEPFTAEDVVYTIETIQNPNVNSPLRASFEGITVEALDDHTVQFTLPEVFAPFLSSLTVGMLPEHVWSEVTPENIRLRKENLQPIGTGPYAFDTFIKDESGFIVKYSLKRFERYYQQVPYIQTFSFRFYAEYDNRTGAIVALKEGKADGIHFVPYEFRSAVERKHIALHTLQLPQYTALFLNQGSQTLLGQVSVRQALTQAVDKERLVKEVLKGEGQIIDGPVLPGYPGYSSEIGVSTYSVEEANTLLDKDWERMSSETFRAERRAELMKNWETQIEAAKEQAIAEAAAADAEESTTSTPATTAPVSIPDFDEAALRFEAERQVDEQLSQELHAAQTFYRKNKEGKILELTITTVDTLQYKKAAELVAGFWQDIGVKVNLRFLTPKEIDREVLKQRAYDVLLYGAIIGGDPDQYPLWHSSQANYPGLNLAGYKNRNVDALLEKAREVTDEQELSNIYKEFQEYVAKDRPAIFLYMPTYTYAMGDDVYGFDVDRIFTPSDRFANVSEWYVKTRIKWR